MSQVGNIDLILLATTQWIVTFARPGLSGSVTACKPNVLILVLDTTLTYTAVDLKLCHILSIWWVEVQVSTRQVIHHSFASGKNLNGIAALRLRIMLLLTLQVCFNLILSLRWSICRGRKSKCACIVAIVQL